MDKGDIVHLPHATHMHAHACPPTQWNIIQARERRNPAICDYMNEPGGH